MIELCKHIAILPSPHLLFAAVKVNTEIAYSLKLVASEVWGIPGCDIHQGSGVGLERALRKGGEGRGKEGEGRQDQEVNDIGGSVEYTCLSCCASHLVAVCEKPAWHLTGILGVLVHEPAPDQHNGGSAAVH